MTDRRQFLKAGVVAAAIPSHRVLQHARACIHRGALGPIAYCRIADDGLLSELRLVLGDAAAGCVIEVDPSTSGATLLGARATLTLTDTECLLFTAA